MATAFDLGGLLGPIFGSDESAIEDLLTEKQRSAIQNQGLLAAAAALLQAGGPSRTPTSLGQALGAALTAGQAGSQRAQESALTQMLTRQKLEDAARGRDMQRRIGDILTTTPATGEITAADALAAPGMAAGPTVARAAMIGQPRPAAPAMSANEMRAQQYRRVADVYAASGKGEDAKRFMDIAESLAPTRQEVVGEPIQTATGWIQRTKTGGLVQLPKDFEPVEKIKPIGQPFQVTDQSSGKEILVQSYDNGTIKPVEGFGPKRDVVLQTVDGRVMAIDKASVAAGQTFGTGRDVRPVDVGGRVQFVDFSSVAPGTTLGKTLAPQVVGGAESGFFVLGGGAGGAAPARPGVTAPAAAAPGAVSPAAAAAASAVPVAPAAAPAGIQPIIPGRGKGFEQEKDLRSEFDKAAKPFIDLAQSFQKIETAAKNPSGAGDISLVYGYMKVLDPGSVVREGEFATAANAGGIPATIRSLYNRALDGQRLSDTVRADFLSQARNIIESQRVLSSDLVERYKGLAKQYQLDPDRIAADPFKRIKTPEEILRESAQRTPATTPAANAPTALPANRGGFFDRFNLVRP